MEKEKVVPFTEEQLKFIEVFLYHIDREWSKKDENYFEELNELIRKYDIK